MVAVGWLPVAAIYYFGVLICSSRFIAPFRLNDAYWRGFDGV